MSTPQKSTFSLAIVTILIVIFMTLVAIRPAVTSVIKQYNNNKERRQLIQKQNLKLDNIKKALEKMNDYSFNIELLEESSPLNYDSEYIVQNVSDFVDKNSGLKISGIKFEYRQNMLTEVDPSIGIINVEVTFDSDIDGALALMEFVENFPRVLNIHDASFSATTENTGILPINGSINFDAYYYITDQNI